MWFGFELQVCGLIWGELVWVVLVLLFCGLGIVSWRVCVFGCFGFWVVGCG